MPSELNNLKKFLIFVPIAAGVSLIHVDRFLDGSLDEHVRQIFTARMSANAVKFRQLQKPQFSLQELQAVLVPSMDRMHGFDVEYAAKRAVPIDGEALDRLFALPKPPKPPRKVVPTVKIKRPNLVEKVKAILRVDMLSTRGAVINSHLYYLGDELNERIPPLRGSRLPIPLYLEAISIKNKSAMIRIGKTGKVAEVPMVY